MPSALSVSPYNPPVTADSLPLRQPPGQTLLFDADDTLWENNIYFERAISAFISYLDHRVHSPEEVREHLNRVERATIQAQGSVHARAESSLAGGGLGCRQGTNYLSRTIQCKQENQGGHDDDRPHWHLWSAGPHPFSLPNES